MAIGAYIV